MRRAQDVQFWLCRLAPQLPRPAQSFMQILMTGRDQVCRDQAGLMTIGVCELPGWYRFRPWRLIRAWLGWPSSPRRFRWRPIRLRARWWVLLMVAVLLLLLAFVVHVSK